jgi:hypothetical protein
VADFTPTRIKDQDINGVHTPSGPAQTMRKRLLGDAGATVAGKGEWVRMASSSKTFFLYNVSRTGAVGAAVVQIHGAMELADVPENTAFQLLATLNAATPHFNVTAPWSYMRAEVTVPGAAAVQVGMDTENP